MKIYDSQGAEIYDVEVNSQTKLKKSLRGTDIINAVFITEDYLDLKLGDYVTWRGVNYTLMDEPSVNKIRSNEYRYNIDFKAPKYQFSKAVILFEKADDQGNPILVTEFFIYGNLQTVLNEIVLNINRVLGAGTVGIGSVPSTANKNVQFSNIDGLTAIDDIVALWEMEWELDGNLINVMQKIGNESTGYEFQFKNGLRTIERKKLRENELTTRLYALGSKKNVNIDYGYPRIRIEPIEENVDAFGVIERTKIWEDVFPHREGTVKGTDNIFTFSDSAMDFDLNQHLIGIPAKVTFNTGDLQGYEFELVSYNTVTKTFVLQEYSDETGLTLPNETFYPRVGDVFILHDIKLPSVYYTNAELELKNKAEEYMLTASLPTVEYEVKPDISLLREENIVLDIGDTVTVKDSTLKVDIETRIVEMTQSIAEPFEYTFKVGNKTGEGFVRQISERTNVIYGTVNSGFSDTYVQINHLKNKTSIKNEYVEEEDGLVGNIDLKAETKGLPFMAVGFRCYPNYEADATQVFFESSTFHHFTIQETKREWTIQQALRTASDANKTYFVYVQCQKVGNTGLYLLSEDKLITESGSDHYFFLIGSVTPVLGTERVFTSIFAGSGQTSVTNYTVVSTGESYTAAIIAEMYHSNDNVNQFTDALYTKLVNMTQSANVMTVDFQTHLRFKAQGNTDPNATEKNDLVAVRLSNGQLWWLIYNTGDQGQLSSYRIVQRTDLTLFP